MRIRQALTSCAVSIAFSISMTPPAVAQSFFQKLFGLGGNQSVPQAPARPQTHTIPSHRFEYRPRPYQQSYPASDDEIGPPDSGGPYRTMCVRSCVSTFRSGTMRSGVILSQTPIHAVRHVAPKRAYFIIR